jgi:hypothetical protein
LNRKSLRSFLVVALIALIFATSFALFPNHRAFAASACASHPSSANCDGTDPAATGCASLNSSTPLSWTDNNDFGGFTLDLRWSAGCETNWARITLKYPINWITTCFDIKVVNESNGHSGNIPGGICNPAEGQYWSNQVYSPGPAYVCIRWNSNGAGWPNWTCPAQLHQ